MIKGGPNTAHVLSSVDSTDTAGLPELHIEPDINLVDDKVWIDDNEVPNPFVDYSCTGPLRRTLT